MKKLMLLSALALVTTTLFSCTADAIESDTKSESKVAKTEITKEKLQLSYEEGPGDDPVIIDPPKKH